MQGKYGVKLVRGPVVDPPPHPLSCEDEVELRRMLETALTGFPRAIDLFCGAGGLSLGLERAGYAVILGVDTDPDALRTHRALCPGLSVDWDLSDASAVDRVGRLVAELDVELVAGGPPCQPFSKAGRSMLRHLVRAGRREAEDLRAQLWRSFMRVVEIGRPRAVLMENVPDMVLDRDMLVLRTMTEELEDLGYGVEARLVDTFRYGVPQFRQRLLLVALAEGAAFEWPPEDPNPVRLIDAIGDLPPVEGGWRPEAGENGFLPYEYPENPSGFVREMRRRVPPEEEGRIYDHITRPVRDDDREAFAVMTPSTKYSELPEGLRRYRDDIFDDKYKRLDWHSFSRTITAHIAKDGYWYIHPEQERTLTVREAARIQTFPDHVRFAGPPTAAFRQIGNAVPPRAAAHVASAIRASLRSRRGTAVTTRETSERLARWMVARVQADEVEHPIAALVAEQLLHDGKVDVGLRWPALLVQLLLPRVSGRDLRNAAAVVLDGLATPLTASQNDRLLGLLASSWGAERRVARVREARDAILAAPWALDTPEGLESLPGVTRALARAVCRMVPGPDSDPVVANAPLLRVAARHAGSNVDEQDRLSAGRLAIARLLGVDDEESEHHVRSHRAALAGLALHEIAETICTPGAPRCAECPLQQTCVYSAEHATQLNLQIDGGEGRAC